MLYSSLIETIGNTPLVPASPRPFDFAQDKPAGHLLRRCSGQASPNGREATGDDIASGGTITRHARVFR